jgi:hypothetical protein
MRVGGESDPCSYDFTRGAGSAAGDFTLLDKSDDHLDQTKNATRELGEFLLAWVDSWLILATTLRGGWELAPPLLGCVADLNRRKGEAHTRIASTLGRPRGGRVGADACQPRDHVDFSGLEPNAATASAINLDDVPW